MKNLLFIVVFMLFNYAILAQNAKTNMLIDGKNIEISIEKITDGYKYSFKQEGNAENLPEYNSTKLNRETMLSFTKTAFKEINGEVNKEEESAIQESIDMTFVELVAILFNEDADGPRIATIELKEKIPVYTSSNDIAFYNLIPSNCYVVFKDGFIEQIKVFGKVEMNLINAKTIADSAVSVAESKVASAKPGSEEFQNANRELIKARKRLKIIENIIKINDAVTAAKKSVSIASTKDSIAKAEMDKALAKVNGIDFKFSKSKELMDSLILRKADAIIAAKDKISNATEFLTAIDYLLDEARKGFSEEEKELSTAKKELSEAEIDLNLAEKNLIAARKTLAIHEKELVFAKNEFVNQEQIVGENFRIRDGNEYGFTNIYSIGISSLTNRKRLNYINIFIDNSKNPLSGKINLGEAIDYQSFPKYGTRDYSPANGEAELMKGQKIDLYKPSNEKLLEFKIFTDVVGFGEETPNGLVQLEFEKKLPINTTTRQFFNKRGGWSYLSYIDFEFTYSKIENKVKYLQLDSRTKTLNPSFDSLKRDTTEYYLDALQVFRHQIFQVGANLNLFLFESQPLKFDLEFNLHVNFGYARVIDTILIDNENVNIDDPLNSFMFAPEVKFIFYPEKRLNVSISDKLNWQRFFYTPKNYTIEYKPIFKAALIEGSTVFNTISLDAYYWPSDQGKIFVRYSFNHQLSDINSNFSQFQIGYSMYLKTSKKD